MGYREWTRRTAERLGLSGTVRNLPDGSVEVRVSGGEKALAELESALRRGPVAARVEAVERLTGMPEVDHDGFRVTS